MKFLVLFLATTALASASILSTKNVQITEDGTILIHSENGKQVQIKKTGPYSQREIEIDVTGPNTSSKKIQIESIEKDLEYPTTGNSFDQKKKRSSTTEEVLNEIFKRYLGYFDEKSYKNVIEKVQKAVLNQDVDEKVLDDKISEQVYNNEDMNQLQGQYVSEYYGNEQNSNQYDVKYFHNILFKIFDTEFLRTLLKQQMYDQEIFAQKSNEDLWDIIFSHDGIFDYQFLVEVINTPVLRNYFVAQGFFDKVVLDKILYSYKTAGVFDKYLLQRLVNIQELKQFFIKHGISVYDIPVKTHNTQYYGKLSDEPISQYFSQYNVLMKIFDRQVLNFILTQQNMYNQDMYGQYSYGKLWDMVFAHEGVFDQKYLLQIIKNEELRNFFVQQGFFDKFVLNQILVSYETEGVYDHYLLQRLINTQVLKYFFISHHISVYDILRQSLYSNGNTYSNKYYGNMLYKKDIYAYDFLKKIISQPMYRNIMVQNGIFNKYILDQILYRYNIHGDYDATLLRQLVNKDALYKVLVQYGIVDQTVLREYVDNLYFGLNYLYKNNFFQQTPTMSYKQIMGYGFLPQSKPTTGLYSYGKNYYGDNMMYGQKYYDLFHRYNQGYYGKLYNQYPTTEEQY